MNLAIVCLPPHVFGSTIPKFTIISWVVINPDGGALNLTLSRWSIGWLVVEPPL